MSKKYHSIESLKKKYGLDWSKIRVKNIHYVEGDLTGITLPKDKSIFQYGKDGMLWCTMPDMDLSEYDFNGINIAATVFPRGAKLPVDKEFFQKIAFNSIRGTFLPYGDFSEYDFNGVIMLETIFTEDSILPRDKNFLKIVRFDHNTQFPKEFINRIHELDLEGVNINLSRYRDIITPQQIVLLNQNYPNNRFFN